MRKRLARLERLAPGKSPGWWNYRIHFPPPSRTSRPAKAKRHSIFAWQSHFSPIFTPIPFSFPRKKSLSNQKNHAHKRIKRFRNYFGKTVQTKRILCRVVSGHYPPCHAKVDAVNHRADASARVAKPGENAFKPHFPP
jgi:hypothetical protein